VIAVRDAKRDGRAERLSPAHPGEDLDSIGLDLHPRAASVPTLTPGQISVDVLAEEREPGRYAFDH
jgi:hypothetical protein